MNNSTPIYNLLRSIADEGDENCTETLSGLLSSRDSYHPFPTFGERESWETLTKELRNELAASANDAIDYQWPSLYAVRYLDFKRNGNRTRYAATYNERRNKLAALVFGECSAGNGIYIDQIVNGIWLICEESSWCVPAHIHAQKAGIELPDVTEPIIDLFAAETAVLLAWTLYLLRTRLEEVSPLICPRIEAEIGSRIFEPFMAREDFFWMGFNGDRVNNWNPWINSNVLSCVLLVADDVAKRITMVEKTIRSVDCFLGPYPSDGGCDEGPSYWGRAGASLFDYLELLEFATAGRIDGFSLPIVAEIGRFIYRVHIAGDQYVNFADAPAVVSLPGELVERFGCRIGDPVLTGFGQWLTSRIAGNAPDTGKRASVARSLPAIFWNQANGLPAGASLDAPTDTPKDAPLPRDVWLDEIQVMVARDDGALSAGFFVAAKGGHNDESHNHNDIGTFVVYTDGKPALVDAGVETYRRETFNEKRYSIWTMQSAYHNLLPSVDGLMQSPGLQYRATNAAYNATDSAAALSVDISTAYPANSGMETWNRTVTLNRRASVVIEDSCRFRSIPGNIEMSLLTACSIDIAESGVVDLSERHITAGRNSGAGVLYFDIDRFDLEVETLQIDDERMKLNWGDTLYRLRFSLRDPRREDRFTFSFRRA